MISKKELSRLFKDVSYYRKEEFIDILTDLANCLKEADEERKKAVDKLAEFNKDERIKELEKKLENKRKRANDTRSFAIEPKDVERIDEWKARHEAEKHNGSNYAGAIGGRYTYEFTPTSIGIFGRVRCTCGDHFDYDDGTDW
jgi:hypothetical protein